MKKATKRKLVLRRQCVKALVAELEHACLQGMRGGMRPCNSFHLRGACTNACRTTLNTAPDW